MKSFLRYLSEGSFDDQDIITRLKAGLRNTSLVMYGFLLPDGTGLIPPYQDNHLAALREVFGHEIEMDRVLEAGVIRVAGPNSVECATVPTEAQAKMLVDIWNAAGERRVYIDVRNQSQRYRVELSDPFTVDKLRNNIFRQFN